MAKGTIETVDVDSIKLPPGVKTDPFIVDAFVQAKGEIEKVHPLLWFVDQAHVDDEFRERITKHCRAHGYEPHFERDYLGGWFWVALRTPTLRVLTKMSAFDYPPLRPSSEILGGAVR